MTILQLVDEDGMDIDSAQARTAKKVPYRRCETRWVNPELKNSS